jgi:hypothetical protein
MFDSPGVQVRAVLPDAEEPSLSRHGSLEETGTTHLSCDQRRDRAGYGQADSAGNGREAQSNVDGLG